MGLKLQSLPFLVLLSACALGPDYHKADAGALGVPTQFGYFSSAAQGADLSRWWGQWNDPVLTALIMQALDASTDLKIAQSRVRQAQASRTASVGAQLPQIGVQASASSGGSASQTQDSYKGSASVTWDTDLFGGQRRAAEAAQADVDAAQAGLANTQVELVAAVAQGYLDFRLADRRLDIARRNLASQRETLQSITWRAQAGEASQLELAQAQTVTAQTAAQLPALESSRVAALGQLALLLGTQINQVEPLVKPASAPSVPADLLIGIPAQILAQRPDVQQAERQLAAATARIGQAQADRYPSLTLSGTIGLEALNIPDILSGATIARTLAGALAATIFDGGQLKAQVDIRTEEQQQAWFTYQQAVTTALEQVETAQVAYVRQRERVRSLAEAAQAATRAQTLARAQYQSGMVDYLTLMEADRTRLSAEDALAQAQSSELSNLVDLYKALGGGWDHQASAQESKHE